ncbi:DNA/RNA non-specific endonuclease [Scytonema sp. NUACC21]
MANVDADIQTNVTLTLRENLGVYNPFRMGTRLYLSAPDGNRIGFTFAPQKVTIPGVTYYTPAWVSDVAGYQLESVDAKLTAAGNSFYDMKTGEAYNPASGELDGYEYKLTDGSGNVYYLSTNKGIVEQIATNGTRLVYSDSGITSSTGETIRFVQDAQGRLEQITTPDGTLVKYTYEGSHLVAARNLSTGNVSRYGYSSPSPSLPPSNTPSLLTLATGNPGTPGSVISYGATPQVLTVGGDLGGAVQWNGQVINGVGTERYTFSLRDTEISATATGIVLVSVNAEGDGVLRMPAINGLTPVASNGNYGLYAIDKAGLNLVEVVGSGGYNLQLTVAGDINRDGAVDGVDSSLLDAAIRALRYNQAYDFNRDGVLNAADVQILGSNYGFTANRAPVGKQQSVLTHVDLDATIALNKLATDPEGDAVFFRIISAENGTASLTPDGSSVLFTPNDDYFGTASLTLVAHDGYSTSAPFQVDVNVSNAALIHLDFARRGLRLERGESTELVVVGDFADQQDVVLPYSYLQFASDTSTVASVTNMGVVTGLNDGVSVLSASRNGISAVTALRVGELVPTSEAELNTELAEENGLNVYPQAVMLTKGSTRQLLVGIEGIYDSPDLKASATGTRYFVNNPNIIKVGADGLITALDNGITNVTVIHGASESVVPVRVETPRILSVAPSAAAEAQLGANGGIVEVEVLDADNELRTMQLMIAPGTLFGDTNIRFTPLLNEQLLSLATPNDFKFLSGFKLEAGNDPLMLPVQLAIELPHSLKADESLFGKTAYFFEKSLVPDASGNWRENWVVAESAVVGADGMIRTSSPPWKGVREGEYIVAIDTLPGGVALVKGKLTATYNMPSQLVSLFPASYTVTNGLSSISIGNLDSNVAIVNNYNSAYLSDGKLTAKVFDSSLLVQFEKISVEISGIRQDVLNLIELILELTKEETSLSEDIERLERVYQILDDMFKGELRAALEVETPTKPTTPTQPFPGPAPAGPIVPVPTPKTPEEKEALQKEILVVIVQKEEKLTQVKEKLKVERQKKESLEERRGKLDDQMGSLRNALRAYNSAGNIIQLLDTAPFLSVSYDISSLEVIKVPTVGLPQITPTGVQLNTNGLPSFEVNLGIPAPKTSGPAAPPVLQQAQLRFKNENNQPYPSNQPVLFLTGSNILVDNGDDPLGSSFEDLIVNFQMGSTTVTAKVLADLSERLPNNRFKVAVLVPNTVVLGMSDISITRRQNQVVDRVGTVPIKREIKLDSNEIQLEATGEYIFGTQRLSDLVSVIDGRDPKALFADPSSNVNSSADLLLSRIPVGTNDISDRPRDIAVTSDGTRAYVTLENSGRVALVDPMVLQQIDTNAKTEVLDPISLGTDASPRSIAIDARNDFAYIADSNMGVIYVLDLNPNSAQYHKVVEKIQVAPAPYGLREMAISSDGRRLFVTAPSSISANTIPQQKSQIFVINIDPKDRPTNPAQNKNNWHKQIGTVEADRRVEGISVTNDPNKLVFTNRQNDQKGYGVLEITQNEPGKFAASTRYAELQLGPIDDYFDVNNGISVIVTRDGEYGFVVGNNGGPFMQNGGFREDVDGVQAGSNIGIIRDPLGRNPQLVAATRPIPLGFATDLLLSPDDKYLYVANPNGIGVMTYDIDEIIYTLNHPEGFIIDGLDRSESSRFFDPNTARNAKYIDFEKVPIDDINPAISVTADYGIIIEDRPRNQFTYGVLDVADGFGGWVESSFGPIGTYVFNLAATSPQPDWLRLTSPLTVTGELTPTFTWEIKDETGREKNVSKVELFVSVFDKGKGLLPSDYWDNLTSGPDYNPNRILTATWENNQWQLADGTLASNEKSNKSFTLPNNRMLTAGQKYYWYVRADNLKPKKGEFTTSLPSVQGDVFSSVTILTPGVEPGGNIHRDLVKNKINALAEHLFNQGASVLEYNTRSGKWNPVTYNGLSRPAEHGKPLVLLADWTKNINEQKSLYNSGFSEAAADSLFASLVQLDQQQGGSVGQRDTKGNLVKLYYPNGNLIRNQGSVFNSPLHFIGFGQGAVVNSEIIQRLGTFFPNAGGTSKENRDLQMTTVDPHDYDVNFSRGAFRNILDPNIRVWENVTYADNYFQEKGNEQTLNGQIIFTSDWNVDLGGLAGFDQDISTGGPHRSAITWYAGTLNLSESDGVYRRLGDLNASQWNLNQPTTPSTWYTPDHAKVNLEHGARNAPWEGISTGWFNSILGGGSQLRPYFDDGKKTKQELGDFKEYIENHRVSVYEDNTYTSSTNISIGNRMRGDYAVPTLFNGNFDAITGKVSSQSIPGWSLYNAENEGSQANLTRWHQITTLDQNYLNQLRYNQDQPNYALQLGGGKTTKILHNYFVVPEWGDLRFNLHAPSQNGKLHVYLETEPTDPKIIGSGRRKLATIDLLTPPTNNDNTIKITRDDDGRETRQVISTYENDIYKIDFGRRGFETFHVDSKLLDPFRGQVARLRFELEGGNTVYLDDVFFKSIHLKFGNPTEARYTESKNVNDPYSSNLIIEKPQYTVAYDNNTRNPVWVSWQLNQSWLGSVGRPDTVFAEDPELPPDWKRVSTTDYTFYANSYNLSYGFNQGHSIPSGDRTNSEKDNLATFVGTNLIPQNADNNMFFGSSNDPTQASAWFNIEKFGQRLANQGNELYIVAGSFGRNQQPQKRSNAIADRSGFSGNTNSQALDSNGINIPTWTWKTMLVLDRPGLGINDVNSNTKVYTFLTPNRAEPSKQDWINAGTQGILHPFYELTNLQLNRTVARIMNRDEWRDPNTWLVSIEELESVLRSKSINFLSNVSEDIRTEIKRQIYLLPIPILPPTTSLLAGTELTSDLKDTIGINDDVSIRYSGITEETSHYGEKEELNSARVSTAQIGMIQMATSQIDKTEIASTQVNVNQVSVTQEGFSGWQFQPTKIPFSSLVTSEQIVNSNSPQAGWLGQVFVKLYPFVINYNEKTILPNVYKDNPLNLWSTFFDPANPFDLTFQITDLPTGQLAEAQITKFDQYGRSNGGILTIDTDANGVGWFIDTTPWENSEFTQTLTDTAFRATMGDAALKYDLLTTILHEMGHLAGIINGNPGFDRYVQTINGSKVFFGDNFNATLTRDGSHLDYKVHPDDLMNNTLVPGVRRLPSLLNLQIVNAIRGINASIPQRSTNPSPQPFFLPITPTNYQPAYNQPLTPSTHTNLAPLTAILLAEITNGDFNIDDPNHKDFGWSKRGAATILNKEAVLSENSPFNSNFSQSFIIPEGAKYLQFTLKNTNLGQDTPLAPGDAFEVALLDALTKQSLVNTLTGLSKTDSLLNIQHDGTAYTSSKVKLVNTTPSTTLALNQPLTFRVDLTGVQPLTAATLHFDLLGIFLEQR